jgi:hypothetical protein
MSGKKKKKAFFPPEASTETIKELSFVPLDELQTSLTKGNLNNRREAKTGMWQKRRRHNEQPLENIPR